MKKKLLLITILSVMSIMMFGENNTTAIAVVGNVQVKNADATEFVTLKVNDVISDGATIKTFISPITNVTTTIPENSEVKIVSSDIQKNGDKVKSQSAMLELLKGDLEHSLDVKGMNTEYKVKTPSGVAAARGTIFITSQNGSIVVKEGAVSKNGVTYPAGSIVVQTGNGPPLVVTNVNDLPPTIKSQVSAAINKTLSSQLSVMNLVINNPSIPMEIKKAIVKTVTKSVITNTAFAGVIDASLLSATQDALTTLTESDAELEAAYKEAVEEYPFDEVSPSSF
jgi:hypothetical protein